MDNTSTSMATEAVLTPPKPEHGSVSQSEGLPSPRSPKWLLWTGVLGALLALLSLLAIMILGQKLFALESAQHQISIETQQTLDAQQSQWRAQQLNLIEQQQALATTLRQELTDALTQLDQRLKESQQHQPWQFTDVNVVKLMAAQLQGLSLLSVEPQALKAFIESWQGLLAQQGVEASHPLRLALTQESQTLSRLSAERNGLMGEQSWRVWQGLIDYYAPASADGLIKPTTEVSVSETSSWWSGFLKFIRITPAEQVDTSRLTQLRDATLWQTQASMALTQLRWGVQTNQPRLVQVESQQLAQLLAVMAVSLPESMSAQLGAWQAWSGWPTYEWSYLRDYLAQSVAATQP